MSKLRDEFAETIDAQFQGNEAAFFVSHDMTLLCYLTLDVYQQQTPDDQKWLARVASARIEQQIKQEIFPQSHMLKLRELLQRFVLDQQDDEDESVLFFIVTASQLLAWIDKSGTCSPPENLLKPGVSVNKLWHDYRLLGFERREDLLLSDHLVVLSHLVSAHYGQYMFMDQIALAQVAYMRLNELCQHDPDVLRENLKNILETFCHYYPDELDCERYHLLLFQLDEQNRISKLTFAWLRTLDAHHYHPSFYATPIFNDELTAKCYMTHSKQAQKIILRAVCYRLTQARLQHDLYSNQQIQSYVSLLQSVDSDHELLTWFDNDGFNPFPQHWLAEKNIKAIWQRLCAREFGGSRLSLYQSSHPLLLEFLTLEHISGKYGIQVTEAACWYVANPENRQQDPQRCKTLFEALPQVYQQHGLEMPLLKEDVYFKSNIIDPRSIYKPSQVSVEDITLERYGQACAQTRFCLELFVLERLMHFIYVDDHGLSQEQLDIYVQILQLSLWSSHYHDENTIAQMYFVADLFNQKYQYDSHGLAIDEIQFLCDIKMLDVDASISDLLKLPIDEDVYLNCGHKTQFALGKHAFKTLTPYAVRQQDRLIAERNLPMSPQLPQDAAMLKRILQYHYQDLLWMCPQDNELHSLCLEVLKVLDNQGCYDSRFMMHWSVVVQAYLGDKPNLYVAPDQSPWVFDGSRTIHSSMTRNNFLEGSFRRRYMFVLAAVCLLEQRLESQLYSEYTFKLLHLIDAAVCDQYWSSYYPEELLERMEVLLQHSYFAPELTSIYLKQLQLPDISDEARCMLLDKIIAFAPVNDLAAEVYASHAKQMVWLFTTGLVDKCVEVKMYCRRLLSVSLYEFLKFDNWNNYPQLCDEILMLISKPTEKQLILQAKPCLNRQPDFMKIPMSKQFYEIKCILVDNFLTILEKGGEFHIQSVFERLSQFVLDLLDYYLLCDTPLPKLLFKRIDLLHYACQEIQDTGQSFINLTVAQKLHDPTTKSVIKSVSPNFFAKANKKSRISMVDTKKTLFEKPRTLKLQSRNSACGFNYTCC